MVRLAHPDSVERAHSGTRSRSSNRGGPDRSAALLLRHASTIVDNFGCAKGKRGLTCGNIAGSRARAGLMRARGPMRTTSAAPVRQHCLRGTNGPSAQAAQRHGSRPSSGRPARAWRAVLPLRGCARQRLTRIRSAVRRTGAPRAAGAPRLGQKAALFRHARKAEMPRGQGGAFLGCSLTKENNTPRIPSQGHISRATHEQQRNSENRPPPASPRV